jgi:hypothetical protein
MLERKKIVRKLFEWRYHCRKAENRYPAQDCLSCAKSTSEPSVPFDTLHCGEMKQDDVVDENMVCDLWSN